MRKKINIDSVLMRQDDQNCACFKYIIAYIGSFVDEFN